MRMFSKIAVAVTFMGLSNLATAAGCGSGIVLELREGGWNDDHFLVKIDHTLEGTAHSGTEFQGFFRFEDTLEEKRLAGIRSLAKLALISGKPITTYSHNNSCSSATELGILSVQQPSS